MFLEDCKEENLESEDDLILDYFSFKADEYYTYVL